MENRMELIKELADIIDSVASGIPMGSIVRDIEHIYNSIKDKK